MSWSHDYWPKDRHAEIMIAISEMYEGKLPDWAMAADLVYLADMASHPTRPQPFPGRREIEKRWGASERTVRNALADNGWQEKATSARLELPERRLKGGSSKPLSPFATNELTQSPGNAPPPVPAPVNGYGAQTWNSDGDAVVPVAAPGTSPSVSPSVSPSGTDERHEDGENVPVGVPVTAPEMSPSVSTRAEFGPIGPTVPSVEQNKSNSVLPEEGKLRTEHSALEFYPLTQPGTERSPLFEPVAAPTEADVIAIPPWAKVKGHNARDVLGAVVRGASAVRGKPANPDRCATDAKPIIALQKATGTPWPELGEQLERVAEWARDSSDPLAARDIRAEGWTGGVDRSRSVSTLCVQERWADRLEAALRWHEPPPAPVPKPEPRMGHARYTPEQLAALKVMREEKWAKEREEREKKLAEMMEAMNARRLTMPPLVIPRPPITGNA